MQNQTPYISPIANSPSPISNNRLPWLDFASGIMILWMIIYHALQASWGYEVRDLWGITDASLLPKGIHAFINSEGKLEVLNPCVVFPWLHFFMPWFFYKSGQFFKKTSTKDLWKKDSQKLLKTFVIWSAIGYIFYLLIGLLNDSLTLRNTTYSIVRGLFLTGKVPINAALWFLLTLFGVRFFANKLLPDREDKYAWLKIISIVLVGYVVCYLAFRLNHRLMPYWVANGAAGLSFFAFGYAMRDLELKRSIIVFSVLVYIICCFFGFPTVDMMDNKLLLGNYLLWIPVSLCCIVTFNALCQFFYRNIRIRYVEIIGKNALTIFVTHSLVYITVVSLFLCFEIQVASFQLLGEILAAYILILPIFCVCKSRDIFHTNFVKILSKSKRK